MSKLIDRQEKIIEDAQAHIDMAPNGEQAHFYATALQCHVATLGLLINIATEGA